MSGRPATVDRERLYWLERLGLPREQLRRLTPRLIEQLTRCPSKEAQRMLVLKKTP